MASGEDKYIYHVVLYAGDGFVYICLFAMVEKRGEKWLPSFANRIDVST